MPGLAKFNSAYIKICTQKCIFTINLPCSRMMSASMKFLQLLAVGLGLPESYFHHLFVPDTLSTLRLLHYPQRNFTAPPVAVENGQVVVCETHADNVFVTFLITFHYKGES